MAVTSLVLGIVSILCCGFILGPVAAILGFISRNRILASGGALGGAGMAMVGIITGIVGFVVYVIVTITYFAIFAASASQAR